jgi:hypothetical protein
MATESDPVPDVSHLETASCDFRQRQDGLIERVEYARCRARLDLDAAKNMTTIDKEKGSVKPFRRTKHAVTDY